MSSSKDSIWYHEPREFREFLKTITDKSMTVADALVQFRELKCLPSRFKEMRGTRYNL